VLNDQFSEGLKDDVVFKASRQISSRSFTLISFQSIHSPVSPNFVSARASKAEQVLAEGRKLLAGSVC
jgi:hypothetical protein